MDTKDEEGTRRRLLHIGQLVQSRIANEYVRRRVTDIFASTVPEEAERASCLVSVAYDPSNTEEDIVGIFATLLQIDTVALPVLSFLKYPSREIRRCLGNRPVLFASVVGIIEGTLHAGLVFPQCEPMVAVADLLIAHDKPDCLKLSHYTWLTGQFTNLAAEVRSKKPKFLHPFLVAVDAEVYKEGPHKACDRWNKLPELTTFVAQEFLRQFQKFVTPNYALHSILGSPEVGTKK